MAVMLPEIISTKSAAERALFSRLRRELPDTVTVLHSLGLADHPKKIVGEADFVIISPLGIFVLEVKGGGVACKNGVWEFTPRNGPPGRKKEGPWEQARTAMFAVKSVVEKQEFGRGLLFGYGVVLLDETFLGTGPEIVQEVLLDKRQANVTLQSYLERLHRYWGRKYEETNRKPSLPTPKMVEQLARLLRPDTRSSWNLAAQLDALDREQTELTDEQARIIARLDVNPRTLVTGPAGTGKTLLALDFARRQARQGRKVLYLCFNRLLGRHVAQRVESSSAGFQADSLHSWFGKVIARAGLQDQLAGVSGGELYGSVMPRVFEDALVQTESEFEAYDLVVLDEAQDLLRVSYLDAIGLGLRNGFERGRWCLFMDENQAIFEEGFDPDVLRRLEGYGCARFPLVVNCRNTLQIAKTVTCLSGVVLSWENAVSGQDCRYLYYGSGDGVDVLEEVVAKYLADGVDERDMIILSPNRISGTTLEKRRIAGRELRDLCEGHSAEGRTGFLDACTMHAFKGLERKVVIAWGVKDIGSIEKNLLLYCGLSRARTSLTLVLPANQRVAVGAQIEKNAPLTYPRNAFV